MILLLLLLAAAAQSQPLKIRAITATGPQIVEFPLERYVVAAVTGESSVFQSAEALKAMTIAARTYAVRHRGRHASEGFDFCSSTHCQRLERGAFHPGVESAASETIAELLWYEGKPAFTPYSLDCGGFTEQASTVWPDEAASYLTFKPDPYCRRAGASSWQWAADPQDITSALSRSSLRSPPGLAAISILEKSPSGRALTLALTGDRETVRISAGSFRFAIGRHLGWNTLRGDLYQVRSAGGKLLFQGSGSGHGVGLCQRGAEQMGLAGLSHQEILAFYFPGTKLGISGRGHPWRLLAGDSIQLLTTQPDQDRVALAEAERQLRHLAARTRLEFPRNVQLRIYPDVETFRNATGEPGWVAARTRARRIHLQPVHVLRRRGILETTLGHELLHVLLESHAAPALPLWFREGLAGFLESGPASTNAPHPSDTGLRQKHDPALARRNHAASVAAVSALVRRYSEETVFDWLKRGLPAEVANASTSQPAASSR